MNVSIKLDRPCPVCNSTYTVAVQQVVGHRTGAAYLQFFCMDCRSFFHRTGYIESEQQKASDFNELFQQRENHGALQSQLLLELITRVPGTRSVLEVGHGVGLLLRACHDYGLAAVGFEVNESCHKFAKNELHVDSRLGFFDDSHGQKYDLIVALQVFEHLEQPRELFDLMRRHLNPDGAIYLSVPFVERNQWRFLWDANKLNPKHPADVFQHNDVHITNFSVDGMKQMGLGMGARIADYFVSKDVFANSPGAYQGVLFHF